MCVLNVVDIGLMFLFEVTQGLLFSLLFCIEFWLRQRETSYVAQDEQWKCGYCDFVSECPAYNGY